MANISGPQSKPSAGNGRFAITETAPGEFLFRVEGAFDFELARALLHETREKCREGACKVTVEMVGVTQLLSCGIGLLSILCELAEPGQFSIRLIDCSPEVAQLFELGILDHHLGPRLSIQSS